MLKAARELCEKYSMLKKGETVVAGLSGGADSVCLLLFLREYLLENKISLHAVHINHGIRGEEADRDEAFCRKLCADYNIELTVFHENIPELVAKTGLSEEEAGRKVRYECFARVCKQIGASKIAIAHNSDDQTETILFNIIRGCRLEGLSGIKPVSTYTFDSSITIIRPLLLTSRKEIEKYLLSINREWCTDSTNHELEYTRNIIRQKLLPEMRNLSLQVDKHIRSLGEEASEAKKYISEESDARYKLCVMDGKLFISELEKASDYIQREIIYKYICEVTSHKKDISSIHVEVIKSLIKKSVGKMVCLPYDICVVKEYDCIKAYRQKVNSKLSETAIQDSGLMQSEAEDIQIDADMLKEGITVSFGEAVIELKTENWIPETEIPRDSKNVWIDAGKAGNNLTIRSYKEGDYFCPFSDGRKKSVGRFFIDSRIPYMERKDIKLLLSENRAILIGNLRHDEAMRIDEGTKTVLKIRFL